MGTSSGWRLVDCRLKNLNLQPCHHPPKIPKAWQRVVSSALVTSTLVNVGTVLSVSAVTAGATLSFAGAALFGAMMLGSYLQVGGLCRLGV